MELDLNKAMLEYCFAVLIPVWKMLRSLPNLNEVTLSGNPWSCQCDFVQKLQNVVSESKPDTVSDFAQLQCVAGSASSDIGRVNLTCADVLAVSFRYIHREICSIHI